MNGSSVNLSYNIDALKYDPVKDEYSWDKGFGGPIDSNDPIIKTRIQLVKINDKNLSFTIFTLQDSGLFYYESWVYSKKSTQENQDSFLRQSRLRQEGVIPADLLLTDFDNVYVGTLLNIPDRDTILIYASRKNSPNITQIEFDRDTQTTLPSFYKYEKHTDWYLNEKMGRSTAIASNLWEMPDPTQNKVLILSNSMGGSLWQMFLDPKNPTQIDFEFETKKFADWDGQKLYVT